MRSILITGGAGFIGSRLSRKLVQQGCRVTVLDNLHPQVHANPEGAASELAALGVPLVVGDICDRGRIDLALARSNADTVVHLAAETGTGQSHDVPARYCEANITGTAHLIEAIRAKGGVRRVLLAGSRAVYGEGACVDAEGRPALAVPRLDADMKRGDYQPRDAAGRKLTPVPTSSTRPPTPMSIYASTKLMQEYLLQQGFWESGVEVGILRLQNVYGPGQSLNNPYTGVLSIFARHLMDGKQLNIFEDGDITRDFVYVDDVVAAFAALAAAERCPREIVDIGTGEPVTILEVARHMLRLLELPADRLRISGDFRPGDIRYAVADVSRATTALGWTPKVRIAEGLDALVCWTRDTTAATRKNG